MIRRFEKKDEEAVIRIWLDASIKAHNFVPAAYWQSKVKDMRELYLPQSDTLVIESNGVIEGFISLLENYIAAIFVAPETQGRGIGKQLMEHVKKDLPHLHLSVYSKNKKAIDFYKKQGFEIQKEQTEPHTGEMETLMAYTA